MDSKVAHSMEELEKMFSSRMREYEDKLQKATTSSDPKSPDLTALSHDFADFKSFVCTTLRHLKTQVELLSIGLDCHETALRRKILLFHGVPEKPSEKLTDVISQIVSNKLSIIDFKVDHLRVCHRLGAHHGKNRPVLVRFKDIEHRRLVWDSKTTLKGSGITISEFLTKTRHQVFIAARKHFGINSCWSAEGKVIVMTPEKTRRKVVTMGELGALIALYPINAVSSGASAAAPSPTASTSSATASILPKPTTPKGKLQRKTRR